MRIARVALFSSAAAALLAAGGRDARAQNIDVNPPLPNVLILLDTSGSMERMIDGSLPEDTQINNCNCDPVTGWCDWGRHPPVNRWGTVIQSFAGSFSNLMHCVAMPRTVGSVFDQEYSIGGQHPYDIGYYIPYHRWVARDMTVAPNRTCDFAPGVLPGATQGKGVGPAGNGAGGIATAFPPNSIVRRPYLDMISTTDSCDFTQYTDGAIDANQDIMRFALMTFDTDPGPGTGVTIGPNFTVLPNPFPGTYSYFPGWDSGGVSNAWGNPANCGISQLLEVGGRNPAAPPWEGRMVPFASTNDLLTQESVAQQIKKVIMATRPFSATPTGGLFADARRFFWDDPTFGPRADPYVLGGCRDEYIILLTDGPPNLDLRSSNPNGNPPAPGCDIAGNPAGKCPFPKPEETAATLYAGGGGFQHKVTTFVIGFAMSAFKLQGVPTTCASLVNNGQLSPQCSNPPPPPPLPHPDYDAFMACCELQRIAIAGGSKKAYFADTQGDLNAALAAVLASIAQNTTTRTSPAYSPIVTNVVADPNNPQVNAAKFLASFKPTPGSPWRGDVQRQREMCTYTGNGYTVPNTPPQTQAGDDFAANLDSHTGPQRIFIGLLPDQIGGGGKGSWNVDSTATIRPYVSPGVGDNLGKYGATTYVGAAGAVIGSLTSDALQVDGKTCQYTSNKGNGVKFLSANQCKDMLLDFTFAQQSFNGPNDFSFTSRWCTQNPCEVSAFGDVFHATPMVVGAPGSLLRDDSYVGFRQKYASRRQVVYVATNDGLLHAFWADENKLENNEMWAMLPPGVMPNLLGSYPGANKMLLDGSPVVKDIVWDRTLLNATDPTSWHSTLVASFGTAQRGYYAVDVTQPDPSGLPSGTVPPDPPPGGPVFRWQLTRMPAGSYQVFGAHSATPALTTLFMDPGDGKGIRDIGVAILPGGMETGPTSFLGQGPACARAPKVTDSAPSVGFKARSSVRCWGANQLWGDPVIGRSVAVVRADTGEILRVFMRKNDAPKTDALLAAGRITDTALDSPMTGTAMVYPADVGSDGKKVFIGDADGTTWKFDLTSTDPSKWWGEMYLDFYNSQVDVSPNAWSDGQPIKLSPVLSLDNSGQVVLNAAAGDNETFTSTGTNYIYSVTEKVAGGGTPKLRANVNWYLPLINGEVVSGAMTVFDGVHYFATYAASNGGQNACAGGLARLWGRDFIAPDDPNDLSKGGARRMQPPPPNPPLNPPPIYVQPSDYDPTLLGKVIPGVSIQATPACASLGLPGPDQYVAGAMHQTPQNLTPGSYSLMTQIGAAGKGGFSTATYSMPVATPTSPTVIDSWASVLE